jgi:hypothetical protein
MRACMGHGMCVPWRDGKYLDEAVVEMEAGEAGVDAHVGLVRLDEHLLHDVVGVRACAVVVVRCQLRHGAAGAQGGRRHQQHAGEDGGRRTMGTRGSCHLNAGMYVYVRAKIYIKRSTSSIDEAGTRAPVIYRRRLTKGRAVAPLGSYEPMFVG